MEASGGATGSKISPLAEESKEDSEYMLRWSEHNSQLISVFHQLCQDGEFTDVTLATEEGQFQAHKLILSACSPYFRSLFSASPCSHPIVFLKDVPDSHVRLLLEYMYRGSISVRHHQLSEILRTASSLKIRGLTTAEPPASSDASSIADDDRASTTTPRPLVVDEGKPQQQQQTMTTSIAATAASSGRSGGQTATVVAGGDKFHHVETGSSHSGTSGRSNGAGGGRKPDGGRKSSMPKKLRLSGDSDSGVSGGSGGTGGVPVWPISLKAEVTERNPSSDENIAASEEEEEEDEDREEVVGGVMHDHDQPVDFSKGKSSPLIVNAAPRYSILGQYLKNGAGVGGHHLLHHHHRAASLSPQEENEVEEVGADGSPARIIHHDVPTAAAAYEAAIRRRSAELTAEDFRRNIGGGGASSSSSGGSSTNSWLSSLEQLHRVGGGMAGLISSSGGGPMGGDTLHHQLGLMNGLVNGGGPRPTSRDSRGESKEERDNSFDDIENSSKENNAGGSNINGGKDVGGGGGGVGLGLAPLASLTDSLGIDIADRLRSHFLANLPAQSYNWLSGMAGGANGSIAVGGGGGGGGGVVAPHLANNSRHSSGEKEKHPLGGIKTGEVGPNGKPSVACEVCGKKLADPSSLYRHRKIHSGDKPHKCPHCPRRFIQRYNMKQHIKTHRLETMKEDSAHFMDQVKFKQSSVPH